VIEIREIKMKNFLDMETRMEWCPLSPSELHEMHTWDEILRLIVPDVNSKHLGPMEKAMVKRYFDLRRRSDSTQWSSSPKPGPGMA
jgi:hypothetical protein